METAQGVAAMAAPIPSDALMLSVACIQLVTELAMALGVDEDGSSTPARARAIVGEMVQVAECTRLRPDMADEVELRRVIGRRLSRYLRTVSPLITRFARPAGFDGFGIAPHVAPEV